MTPAPTCCCRWGAAVRGEWPEFQRECCEVHTEDLMVQPGDRCRRHKRASSTTDEQS